MAQRNDDELAFYLTQAVKASGQISDEDSAYLLAQLSPYTGAAQINDLWRSFWVSVGIPNGDYAGMAYAWLISQGIPAGSITDMWAAYFNVTAFKDNFNRADDGDITTSPDWTTPDAGDVSAAVVSNQLHIIGVVDRLYQCPDQGSPNHYTQILRTSGANNQFFDCCVRATNGQNFIGIRIISNVFQLWRRNAGTLTLLDSYGYVPLITDLIRLEVNAANEIRGYLNGILRVGPIVDTFNATETRQGFNTRNELGEPAFDNFEAGAL